MLECVRSQAITFQGIAGRQAAKSDKIAASKGAEHEGHDEAEQESQVANVHCLASEKAGLAWPRQRRRGRLTATFSRSPTQPRGIVTGAVRGKRTTTASVR